FRGNDCLKWKKPDHRTIKINCDASWTSESRWAAIAAVVRDCIGKDQGKMIVAFGDALWDNGTVCGKMFTMTCTRHRNPIPHQCTGKTVTIKIVDQCLGFPSTIDLSREAFAIITNPVASIINVDYKQYA
ncbi:hypothetical protein Goklo_008143, partial [Gossypium klotzschianum]|nr:hypothetical protein [Gossypium klotzschianum]